MKRFLITFGLLVMMLAMTACGKKKNDEIQVGSGDTTTPNYYHDCGGSIKLGEYKGVKYTKPSTEVTEEELQKEIEAILEETPNYEQDEERNGTEVKEKDVLNIDYVGSIDGEKFDGGSAEGYHLEIGSGAFIDGFEDSLIGKTIGEEVVIKVTFPDPYKNNEALAGKEAEFAVTINYCCKVVDELTDAYVASYSDDEYKTVEEFKTALKENMEEQKKNQAESKKLLGLIQTIIGNSEITVDDADVDFYYKDSFSMYEYYASMYGISVESFVSMMGGYEDYSKFTEELKKQATDTVKQYMVLEAIIEKEGMKLTSEEYEKKAKEYMTSANISDLATFEKTYGKNYIEYCILTDMAWELIESNAVEEDLLQTE